MRFCGPISLMAGFLLSMGCGGLDITGSESEVANRQGPPIEVDEAALEDGDLEVVGETGVVNATITVDGCAGVAADLCGCPVGSICQTTGLADDEGAFDITASNFASPTCQLLVSDGANSVLVSDVEDCEPVDVVTPPPPVDPGLLPDLGTLEVDDAALEEGSLDVVGESTIPFATIFVDGCAGVGLDLCACPNGSICQVAAQADDEGGFEVAAENFASPTCVLVVSDGTSSILVDEVEDCEPTSALPPPVATGLLVDEAALEDGELEVIGEGTAPFAIITVDGCAGQAVDVCGCPLGSLCQVTGTADDEGGFEIEAEDFASPSCTLLVSDGSSSVVVEVEDCE